MNIVDYIVIEKHETEYPNPITLTIGEKVIIGEEHEVTESENWENWIFCTKADNSNSGWVPKQIIDHESERILRDYSAKELTVEEGVILEGIEELNGWLLSKNKSTGEVGWIPMENIMPKTMDSKQNKGLIIILSATIGAIVTIVSAIVVTKTQNEDLIIILFATIATIITIVSAIAVKKKGFMKLEKGKKMTGN